MQRPEFRAGYTAAELRGRELLRSCLRRGQREQFELTGSFLVEFPSGNVAEISRHSYPVAIFQRYRGLFRLKPTGALYQACIQMEDNSNRHDRMLAIKLAMETNGEGWFWKRFKRNLFYCEPRPSHFADPYAGTFHLMKHLESKGFRLE